MARQLPSVAKMGQSEDHRVCGQESTVWRCIDHGHTEMVSNALYGALFGDLFDPEYHAHDIFPLFVHNSLPAWIQIFRGYKSCPLVVKQKILTTSEPIPSLSPLWTPAVHLPDPHPFASTDPKLSPPSSPNCQLPACAPCKSAIFSF